MPVVTSSVGQNAQFGQHFLNKESRIPEGRVCGYGVTAMPGKGIMAKPSSFIESSTNIESSTKLATPENWPFAYEEFRKVWSEDELSDCDLMNALQYDVLSLSLLDGQNNRQAIRKTVNLCQLKEHLYYKMLNKVLTPEQRQGFNRIRQSFSARQLSDSELLGAFKHRVIKPGIEVEGLKQPKKSQLFIDYIQQQAPKKALEAFYRCRTKAAALAKESEKTIRKYRPGDNSELYRDYYQHYIPVLSGMFPKRRYDQVRSEGNCFYQSATQQIVAFTGKPLTAKSLRRKMHLQAFQYFHQTDTPGFQKILEPENGGMSEETLRIAVDQRTIITPVEAHKGQNQSHLWGGIDHIPLLAYTVKRPVILYCHSSQRMGEAPEPICYNGKGLLCSSKDLKGGPRPIIMVHNGVDHFDGMAPRRSGRERLS